MHVPLGFLDSKVNKFLSQLTPQPLQDQRRDPKGWRIPWEHNVMCNGQQELYTETTNQKSICKYD